MVLTDITTDFDPERDQDVNPLLWEIRRERRVELMVKELVWTIYAAGKKDIT